MYLSSLNLWNFRKFGSPQKLELDKPDLVVNFKKGLNLLIGGNDSGKTAVIDAIKLVVKTHSYEWIKITNDDFYNNQDRFRIEVFFEGLSDEEAKHFTEWLSFEKTESDINPYLKVILDVVKKNGNIINSDIRAGTTDDGTLLNAEAREYLKAVYLKPLRDAKNELIPKRNSRLSQILQGHEAFKGHDDDHHLVNLFREFNISIEKYFDGQDKDGNELITDLKGKQLKEKIDLYLKSFSDIDKETQFGVVEGKLQQILEKLELTVAGMINPGLGTHNRLFMASELLHLNKSNWDGIRLGIIEEVEAHLHPQIQLQVMNSLQDQKAVQLIVSTHSPNIGSKVPLEKILLCNENNIFPFTKDDTNLDPGNYKHLERFLDVTKANLFFAKGVIMVEGMTEELLIPALAKKMNKDLTKCGVSIVNVGSTAFLHYSKIFQRKVEPFISVPVSIITDLDVKPENENTIEQGRTKKDKKINSLKNKFDGQNIKSFISPHWTLEYCLHKSNSLSEHFEKIVKDVHSGTDFSNFETELRRKLENGGLKKVEIGHRLAMLLMDDSEKDEPDIIIDGDDQYINYLIEAINHACR